MMKLALILFILIGTSKKMLLVFSLVAALKQQFNYLTYKWERNK